MDAVCFPADEPIGDWYESDWYLAYKNGEIVGYASKKELGGGITYFNRVGVLPVARGQGIQKKFLERRIKDSEGTQIITYTLPSNPASSNNLIRQGFLLYLPTQSWVGDEVLYWTKEV